MAMSNTMSMAHEQLNEHVSMAMIMAHEQCHGCMKYDSAYNIYAEAEYWQRALQNFIYVTGRRCRVLFKLCHHIQFYTA